MERIYSKRGTTSEKDLESSSDNEIILFPTSYLCRWKVAIKQNEKPVKLVFPPFPRPRDSRNKKGQEPK